MTARDWILLTATILGFFGLLSVASSLDSIAKAIHGLTNMVSPRLDDLTRILRDISYAVRKETPPQQNSSFMLSRDATILYQKWPPKPPEPEILASKVATLEPESACFSTEENVEEEK